MNKVICYPRSCVPETFEDSNIYIELLSNSMTKAANLGSAGATLLSNLKRFGIVPTPEAMDFAMIALSVVSTDSIIPRKSSPDGWTRQIDLTVYLHDADKWNTVCNKLENMLRSLSGDFWSLHFLPVTDDIVFKHKSKTRESDCVSLLSGGVDSLVGAIDLASSGKTPLLVSQISRGDADSQRLFASCIGYNNHCQWSCSINKNGESEISTRTRSIMFFAFALLATCGIETNTKGRKEIIVPENGYMSLNIPLDANRIGSLSTKTTHPLYMSVLQEIWSNVGINVDLVLPYKYKTKGEVLMECKSPDILVDNLSYSISCGKYRRHGYRHCGVCVPCLVRRAAFLKAGLEDRTNKGYCFDKLKDADSGDVNAVAMAAKQVEQYGVESLIKSGLSFASGEERYLLQGVVERGIAELGELLRKHGVI
jgi:hypothetical protein